MKMSRENIQKETQEEIDKDAEINTNTDNESGRRPKSPQKQSHKNVSHSTDRQVNSTLITAVTTQYTVVSGMVIHQY